jgi:hypothetical protein
VRIADTSAHLLGKWTPDGRREHPSRRRDGRSPWSVSEKHHETMYFKFESAIPSWWWHERGGNDHARRAQCDLCRTP